MNIPEAETCASTSRPSANYQKTSSSKKSIRQDLFHSPSLYADVPSPSSPPVLVLKVSNKGSSYNV